MRTCNPKAAIRFLSLAVAATLLATALAAQASPSNKWRLQFSGGADSDGTIVLRITPKGGTEHPNNPTLARFPLSVALLETAACSP